jgi:hypothetical protein
VCRGIGWSQSLSIILFVIGLTEKDKAPVSRVELPKDRGERSSSIVFTVGMIILLCVKLS